MSTHLTIARGQFPNALPKDAKIGDEVRFTVTAIIRRIEADLVDISSMDQEQATIGSVETELHVYDMVAEMPA